MCLKTSNSRSSPTTKTFARYVAAFVPLALAVLMNAAPPSTKPPAKPAKETPRTSITPVKCAAVKNSQDCHSRYPTGCSAAGQYDAYLNFWKDQLIDPATAATPVKYYSALADYQKLDASIPSGLTQDNQSAFQDQLKKLGEGQMYGVIGYLYYVQSTGAESSNCDLSGPPGDPNFGNVDYHIGIGFDAKVAQQVKSGAIAAPSNTFIPPTVAEKHSATTRESAAAPSSPLQQNSIIVEMTPHDRSQYEKSIWTLANVQRAVGHQVKVAGQLMVDNEHNLPAENCATAATAADKQTCWRASVWELHPVVRFQVCPSASCALDSTDWVELNQLQ